MGPALPLAQGNAGLPGAAGANVADVAGLGFPERGDGRPLDLGALGREIELIREQLRDARKTVREKEKKKEVKKDKAGSKERKKETKQSRDRSRDRRHRRRRPSTHRVLPRGAARSSLLVKASSLECNIRSPL